MSDLTGRILQNRYRIESYLGRGASGEVFQLVDLENPDDALCVKILTIDSNGEAGFERFIEQFRLARRLRHNGLLRLYDAGVLQPERRPFVISERLQGRPLTHFLKTRPSKIQTRQLAHQLFDAVAFLHEHRLVHMDIKPSNVMVCNEQAGSFMIKLIDYGTLQQTVRGTTSGAPWGTLAYMSPHVLRGRRPAPADDLYSCGVLLFQWITGHLPFEMHDPEDYLAHVRLGWNPVGNASFKACGEHAALIERLLKDRKFSATQALKKLQPAQAPRSFRQPPQAKLSAAHQRTLTDFLERPRGRILFAAAPPAHHAFTELEDFVQSWTFKKNRAFEALRPVPGNSVVATLRRMAERYRGSRIFSGLGPLATAEALTEASQRRTFYNEACGLLHSIARDLSGLVVFIQKASLDDLPLFEFLLELLRTSGDRQSPLVFVVTVESQRPLQPTTDLSLRNCHLHHLLEEYRSLQLWLSAKQQPQRPKRDAAVAVLSLMTQPVPEAQLQHIAAVFSDFREKRRDLESDGVLIRDEDRTYVLPASLPRQLSTVQITALKQMALADETYLPPLAWFSPDPQVVRNFVAYLDRLDATDLYLPCAPILRRLLGRAHSKRDALMPVMHYHLGRIFSFQGHIKSALSVFSRARRGSLLTSPEHRFRLCIEIANVHAKRGAHLDALPLLVQAADVATNHDEKTFADGLRQLAEAVRKGPTAFHLPLLERQISEATASGLTGRLAMRYGQALLWASLPDQALTWLNLAREQLRHFGHHFREARTLRMLSRIWRDRGEIDKAVSLNESALKILRRLPFPTEEMETLVALVYLQRQRQAYEILDEYLCRIGFLMRISTPGSSETQHVREIVWPELLAVRHERENPERALACYRWQARLAQKHRSPQHLYIALFNQALLERGLGRAKVYRRTWKRARAVFEAHGSTFPLRLQREHQDNLGLKS